MTEIERLSRVAYHEADVGASDFEVRNIILRNPEELVRAILTALREPSEEAQDAGRDALDEWLPHGHSRKAGALLSWQAAIDHILGEPK